MFFKVTRRFILVGSAILSLSAHPNGIEQGEKLCRSMTFSDDKMNCLAQVRKGRFYQASAMDICRAFPFVREQIACLENIRNKTFSETIMSTCRSMTFSSKIMDCLAQFGQNETGSLPTPVVIVPPPMHHPLPVYPPGYAGAPFHSEEAKHLRKAIRKAIKQMDKGHYMAARRILEDSAGNLAD